MYQQVVRKNSNKGMKENMLSTSSSNSSFLLNADGSYRDMDDRMTILDCETRETYHKPMSKTRRIAFFASIASIVLVIIVFLLLPCNKNCVAKHHVTKFTKTMNWMKNFKNIELKGPINTLALNEKSMPLSLIFMYRNDKLNADPKKLKQKPKGGIIKLSGNHGEVLWKNEMTNEPRLIDCNLIDCNKNGKNDCLIIDDYGQLACLDDGHWVYYNSNSKAMKRIQENYDFPLIIADLNADDVHEIVMTTYKENFTSLTVVSGLNGKVLAEENQNCSSIEQLQMETDNSIKFVCILNNQRQQMFKNLTSFFGLMTKKPKTNNKLVSLLNVPQHKLQKVSTEVDTQITKIKVLDKELKIENKGTWPRDSNGTIELITKLNGVKKTHFSYSGGKTYIFTPEKFSVNITSIKGHTNENIHGFIIKYWTWNGTEKNYDPINVKAKRENDKVEIVKKLKNLQNNFTNQTYNSAYKTTMRSITETILLIVFNSTHMKAENTSQSNILQICQNNVDSDKNECQPDLKYQEYSLTIADIDNDGSNELISYYSTFGKDDNSKEATLKLTSFVQLFKLETELPKLYSSDYDIF